MPKHRIDWFWNCLKFWIYMHENRKKVVINTMRLKYAMWNTWQITKFSQTLMKGVKVDAPHPVFQNNSINRFVTFGAKISRNMVRANRKKYLLRSEFKQGAKTKSISYHLWPSTIDHGPLTINRLPWTKIVHHQPSTIKNTPCTASTHQPFQPIWTLKRLSFNRCPARKPLTTSHEPSTIDHPTTTTRWIFMIPASSSKICRQKSYHQRLPSKTALRTITSTAASPSPPS